MRLIDADEAIARIDAKLNEVPTFTESEYGIMGYSNACVAFKRMLESLPTVSEWIPVSERLPEEREWAGTKKFGTTKSDEVYVTFESPKGERFCRQACFQNGKLSNYDQSCIDAWFKGSKPIAWMELPKPYEEEK